MGSSAIARWTIRLAASSWGSRLMVEAVAIRKCRLDRYDGQRRRRRARHRVGDRRLLRDDQPDDQLALNARCDR